MFPEAELHVCPVSTLSPFPPPLLKDLKDMTAVWNLGGVGESVQSNLSRTSLTIRQLSRNRGTRSKQTQNLNENRNGMEEKDNSTNRKRGG